MKGIGRGERMKEMKRNLKNDSISFDDKIMKL